MANNIKLMVYPVKDTEKAKAFFGKFLGVEPYIASPYYIGYKTGEQEVGLDPNSSAGPIAYTEVDDIKSAMAEMMAAGAETVQEPKDVGSGLLVAQIKDSDGNIVGFRQHPKSSV